MVEVKTHRLIWAAWFGPIPPGYDVHHLDSNRLNNQIDNLQCLPHGEHTSRRLRRIDREQMSQRMKRIRRRHGPEDGI